MFVRECLTGLKFSICGAIAPVGFHTRYRHSASRCRSSVFFMKACPAAHECSDVSWEECKCCESFIDRKTCIDNFRDHLHMSCRHSENPVHKMDEYLEMAIGQIITEEVPDHWFEPPPPPMKKRRHACVEHSGTPARKAPPPNWKAPPRGKAPQVKEPPPAFASTSQSSSATSVVQLANAVDTVMVSKGSLADLNNTVVRKQETLINAHGFFVKCASVLENEAEEMDEAVKTIGDIMAQSSASMDVD